MWFLLTIWFSASALDPATGAIERAQVLAVKKNRNEACSTLREALANTPESARSSRARLSETLGQISRMFFTDKGQKAFEAGQSMMFENPEIAISRFREALALEDGNVVVLSNLAKVQLMKQDCEGARASLEKARLTHPGATEPAVLELRTLICQKRFETLREKARQLPPLDKWEDQFVQYILAQESLHAEAPRKAFDSLNKLAEEQPQFPETYLYLAKAGGELSKANEAWLQKYISLCKAVTVKERRRFSLEPRLCANMKEAEDELAKKTSDI